MTTAVPRRGDLARAALWFAARGWFVFPIAPNTKRPAVEDWERNATTDSARIGDMWSRAAFNIGIACGPSGLYVVDLDMPKHDADTPPAPWSDEPGVRDGADVLAVLAERAGTVFPYATHSVATASGGTHLYFTRPDGTPLRNTTKRLGWKVDTRGHGGYVVAAGSVVDGRRYTTLNATRPQPVPSWIVAALNTPKPTVQQSTAPRVDAYAHAALRAELDRVLSAPPGTRNDNLNKAAFALGQLVAAGLLDRAQVEAALTVAAHHVGQGATEAARSIASGLDSGANHPRRTA